MDMDTHTNMDSKEFTEKVIQGERDFRRISLTTNIPPYIEGFDLQAMQLYDNNRELKDYLRTQDLQSEPLILEGAAIHSSILIGTPLPFLKGAGMAFEYDGHLSKGNAFTSADLQGAYFCDRRLEGISFLGANLREATFCCYTSLAGADFSGADLRGIKLKVGVSEDRGLLHAIFGKGESRNTIIGPGEKAMLEQELHGLYAGCDLVE